MDNQLSLSDIQNGLVNIGLRNGMYVEVHSSLSSFGYVEGGAKTIISALKNIITTDGAIIMPAFPISKTLELSNEDINNGLVTKLKILEEDSLEPTGMGVIADTFKNDPEVIVGKGLHRVAAWGNEAEINSQSLCNLHTKNGYALLLGVDIYKLTSMHYVENNIPEEVISIFRPSIEVQKKYPEDKWCIETGKPPIQPWYTIQDLAYKNGYIKETYIGKSRCMFFEVNQVIGLYQEALNRDPLGLFGIKKRL
jgi:aminoglycoside N3'-acetyltransferase